MVKITCAGMPEVKLSANEFNLLVQSLVAHIRYESGGMFGDGETVTDKMGMKTAKRIVEKLHY